MYCRQCSRSFNPTHGNQRFCSTKCRLKYKRKPPRLSREDYLVWSLNSLGLHESNECWIWPYSLDQYGYPTCIRQMTVKPIHASLMWTGIVRLSPPNHHALHSCHNRSCFNPHHLRWGSHIENMHDWYVKNRK